MILKSMCYSKRRSFEISFPKKKQKERKNRMPVNFIELDIYYENPISLSSLNNKLN